MGFSVKTLAALAAVGFMSAGCASLPGNVGTDKEERTRIGNADYISNTADKRYILSVERREPGGGSRQITCAEPSPDVAKATSEAISRSFAAAAQAEASDAGAAASGLQSASGSLNANAAASAAESLSQLGQRGTTIQLLRDLFYRACEAYANGAIDESMYAVILSRTDDVSVTLLTQEVIGAQETGIAQLAAPQVNAQVPPASAALGIAPGTGADMFGADGGGIGGGGQQAPRGATGSVTLTGPMQVSDTQAQTLSQVQSDYLGDSNSTPAALAVTCITILSDYNERLLANDANAIAMSASNASPLVNTCRDFMDNVSTRSVAGASAAALAEMAIKLKNAGFSTQEVMALMNAARGAQ